MKRSDRFVDGPDQIEVALHGGLARKGFDPDEARDQDGKWTDGASPGVQETGADRDTSGPKLGESMDEDAAWDRGVAALDTPKHPDADTPLRPRGTAFVSPSVSDKDFNRAQLDLAGGRQKAFEMASQDIDRELGLDDAKTSKVVGAWADGAENSTMMETYSKDPEALRLSAAMKGALANQKAVLTFQTDPKGPHTLYDMTVDMPPAKVHEALLKAGVAFHTLSSAGTGMTRVVVVDTDGSLRNAVGDFAQAHNAAAVGWNGHAEFIGDQEGTGSDAEQRARGQAAYAGVIQGAASRYNGRSAGDVWQGVRDRWGAPIESQKRALTFGEALGTITKFARPDPETSLYVHRPLANAERLHAWARDAGINNLVPPHEMHVTQVYSRKPVALEPRTDTVTVDDGDRHVAPLGDKGAVVLHFESPELQARHAEAMDAGASHDWPAFLTHVTLSYDNADGTDPSAISGPRFPLQFGPEVHSAINDNWAKEKGLRKYIAANFTKFAKLLGPDIDRGNLQYVYLDGAPAVFDQREAFRYDGKKWHHTARPYAVKNGRPLTRTEFKHYFGEYPHLPEALAELHADEARLLKR